MKYIHTKNRAILSEMIRTDFKVRYQNSVLGYLWSLLKPLFLFTILYIVFMYIIPLGRSVEHYPVYLLLGVVIWNFFVESTILGASSIVSRGDLIRKIRIPRYLVVFSSTASALINLFISLAIVFVFALLNGVAVSWSWLYIFPIIIELVILSMGIAFFLSALYVKYRDITYIWEIFLQAGFYATPIIYPLMTIDQSYHKFFFVNPLAQIIQDSRYLIITQTTTTIWTLESTYWKFIPFIMTMLIAIGGGIYFKKKSKHFAENI